jgi:hypothetical protein
VSLPRYKERALREALSRLDPQSPNFKASDKVRDALNQRDLRIYLDTWVLPQLQMVLGEPK